MRFFFQGVGALVCTAFALQGIAIFVGPDMGHSKPPLDDFWETCHWLSQGTLCVFVGITGFAFEVRGFFPSVKTNHMLFAINRLALALGYLWLGGYSMGGRVQTAANNWQVFGQVTGIVAWIVCVADLLVSCWADRLEKSDEAPDLSKPAGGSGVLTEDDAC